MARFALLLVAAAFASAQDPAKVSRAVDRGREALIAKADPDGRLNPRRGHHALAVLALLHAGLPPGHGVVRRARPHLEGPGNVYTLAVRLMVRERLRAPGFEGRARDDLRRLLSIQRNTGGFGYQTWDRAYADNSCTQFGLMGLRAAEALGLSVPRVAWRRALRHLLLQQDDTGGAGYRSRKDPSVNMTLGVLCGLAMAHPRTALPRRHPDLRRAATRMDRATSWVASRWTIDQPICPYYGLYGVERAMALTGRTRLGARRWYAEGASWLLARQSKNGLWPRAAHGENETIATAYALLFLVRATHDTAPSLAPLLADLATPEQRHAARKAIVARGRTVSSALLFHLESERTAVREVAVDALRILLGTTRGYDPSLSPHENRTAIARWRSLIRPE